MALSLLLDKAANHGPDRIAATDVGGISLCTDRLFIGFCRVNGVVRQRLAEDLAAQ
jgi:hypothetical protein